MGHFVITRPTPDAEALAAQAVTAGLSPLVAPLIDIAFETTTDKLEPLAGASAYAFTSANGVRALAKLSDARDLPAWCVGPVTAALAKEQGFTVAGVADSSVETLSALIAERHGEGRVAHITGSHRAGNLVAALTEAGIEAETVQLYRALSVKTLPKDIATGLIDGKIDTISLFSPRTAAVFRRLMEAAGLEATLTKVTLIGLSQAVTVPLEGLPAYAILAAAQPSGESVIDIARSGRT